MSNEFIPKVPIKPVVLDKKQELQPSREKHEKDSKAKIVQLYKKISLFGDHSK
jgi:hypothetical protein